MATLELQFNCMCLFVPDAAAKVVHVLMPGTNGHEGHAGHEKHVVRMLHRSFKGDERLVGRSLEGWALTLGPEAAAAKPDLRLPVKPTQGGELPDLGEITGESVDPALVGPRPGGRVAARITLRSGEVIRLAAESRWEIDGRDVALAHQVTWRMPDVDPALEWERLDGKPWTDTPLASLKQLEPEDDLVYKLRIFHVTEKALPPRGGVLKPAEMRAHFSAFYTLLDVYPADSLLPRIKEKHVVEVNCAGAQAPVK